MIILVSMLLHASNDTLFLFLSLLFVPVSPIITLTTVPENTNPMTTNGVTITCSVVSHPELEDESLTLTNDEMNSGADVMVSKLLEVSVAVRWP